MIQLKRVYEHPRRSDGLRFLVERLWPRGMTKRKLKLDGWLRELAPSPGLRRWFGHDPRKWTEFQRRYRAELRMHRQAVSELVELARRRRVTLVYSSHDTKHNNAVALQRYVGGSVRRKPR